MTERPGDDKFGLVVHRLEPHSKLLRTWELKGGVSAQVSAIELERPDGQTQTVVVRRHGAVDLEHNPNIAADEFKLLQRLRSTGVAAPTPYYLDQSGEIFSTPYVVLEYIDGKPEFAPSAADDLIPQLATQLARIHAVDCSKLDLFFLPSQAHRCAEKLRGRPSRRDESEDEARIRGTLEAIWPLPQRNPSVLLHGDFWPGNILWKDGRIAGVVDWEDAAVGDPLSDVANSRIEILWAFGIDAMHRFTSAYQSTATVDWTDLPYWDLCAALRSVSQFGEWAADDMAAQTMRKRHSLFIANAYKKLAVQHKQRSWSQGNTVGS